MVKAELESGLLVPAGTDRWMRKIEIRAHRACDSDSREIERVWHFLAEAGPVRSDFAGYAESTAAPPRDTSTRAVRPVKPHRAVGHGKRAKAN